MDKETELSPAGFHKGALTIYLRETGWLLPDEYIQDWEFKDEFLSLTIYEKEEGE